LQSPRSFFWTLLLTRGALLTANGWRNMQFWERLPASAVGSPDVLFLRERRLVDYGS
jgi:hypothetical protein